MPIATRGRGLPTARISHICRNLAHHHDLTVYWDSNGTYRSRAATRSHLRTSSPYLLSAICPSRPAWPYAVNLRRILGLLLSASSHPLSSGTTAPARPSGHVNHCPHGGCIRHTQNSVPCNCTIRGVLGLLLPTRM